MPLIQTSPFGGKGGGSGVSKLSNLTDVKITSVTDEDFLVFDETTGKWINKKAEAVTVDYNNATNKPTINGYEIDGDLTSEDIGITSMSNQQMNDLLSLLQ